MMKNQKVVEEYKKHLNPYESRRSIGIDLVGLTRYAKEHGKTVKELSDEEIRYFAKNSDSAGQDRVEIVEDEAEGGFVAAFPELPGCLSCGETMGLALANAQDARQEWLNAESQDKVGEGL